MRIWTAWAGLAALSALLMAALMAAALPAAILVGPMLVAIGFGVAGCTLRVPRPVFTAAQGVVGCLIATSVTGAVLHEVAKDWPALLFGLSVTMAASAAIGWLLARFGSLPGSTAAWGSSPGAASAMVAMAQDFGADPRLVASMQYVRVIAIVLTSSIVARAIQAAHPGALPQQAAGETMPALAGLLVTLAVALGGAVLGRRLKVPAGALLVPLVIGSAVNGLDFARLQTPPWLLGPAYAAIGWSIGLQFERETVGRSVRALPEILLASAAIIGLCAAAAAAMVPLFGLSPLTAFLATSPGGIDTIAIIALAGGADTPFVMALQTLRVLVVVMAGPWIARFIARTAVRAAPARGP